MAVIVRRTIRILAGLAIVAALASYVGRTGGQAMGAASKERLLLVWPSLMDWSESDRAFLVGLALTCHLYARPAAITEVVDCLRSAVADPEGLVPEGFDRANTGRRLDEMLAWGDAAKATSAPR